MTRALALSALLLPPLPAWAAQKAHAIAHMSGLGGKAVGIIDFAAFNRGILVTFDRTTCHRAPMACTCMSAAIATPRPDSLPPALSCR